MAATLPNTIDTHSLGRALLWMLLALALWTGGRLLLPNQRTEVSTSGLRFELSQPQPGILPQLVGLDLPCAFITEYGGWGRGSSYAGPADEVFFWWTALSLEERYSYAAQCAGRGQ